MFYVDQDPEEFSKKHGVPMAHGQCRKCGKEVEMNIPFIARDFVGFESEDHGCGRGYVQSFIKIRPGSQFDLNKA
jgi:hypothetical protein